jgi:hypothetical protein
MANISTMNIQIGMDANGAERGFNRLGKKVEDLSDELGKLNKRYGTVMGTFLGNALWDTLSGSIQKVTDTASALVNKLADIGKQAIEAARAVEMVDFQKMVDAGANPLELVQSDSFKSSITGTIAYVQEAWNSLMVYIGQKLQPVVNFLGEAIMGFLQGVQDSINAILQAFGLLDENGPFSGIQTIFENSYNIAVATAKALVEGAREAAKISTNAYLLMNPAVNSQANDLMAMQTGESFGWFGRTFLGGISREEYNKRLNTTLEKGQQNGQIRDMLKALEINQEADNWLKKAADALDNVRFPGRRQADPAKVLEFSGLKGPDISAAMAKPSPDSVFAPLMERGGMADWKQTQLQMGVAQDAELSRFRESMKKQDELKAAIQAGADKVVNAVNANRPPQPNGVVAIPK